MTLVSSIITQSLRESNIIAVGANPTPGEAGEALERLQSLVLSVLGNEIGYVLEDWNISNDATAAVGTITFSGLPIAAETVTIGGEVFTFVAAAAAPFEVTIGASASLTGDNLVTTIAADSTKVSATNLAGVVTLTALIPGTAGNAIALAEAATNTLVSGAFLAGATQTPAILKPSGFVQDTDGFTVAPQSRLICNLEAAQSLSLDPQPQDGQRVSVADAAENFATRNLTLVGNGRLIEDAPTKVLSTNGLRTQWVYRSDQANWVIVDPIVSNGEMPFPEEFDDYFIIMLAMRLNPRFGRPLTQESQARLQQQREQLILRYNQSRLREATQMQTPQGGLGSK